MARTSLVLSVITLVGCIGTIDAPLGPQADVAVTPAGPGDGSPLPSSVDAPSATTPGGMAAKKDPSRPTLRRLNRAEYDNTVRDLFGVTQPLSATFPADDVGYGFDNIGAVLSLSPIQLELYQKAARDLGGQLFAQTPAGTTMRQRVIPCDPVKLGASACAEQTLNALAPRAFRRPVSADETTRLLALYSLGAGAEKDFARGLKLALEGVLLSPHFLFRVELDPSPTSLDVHPLGDYELATRLSYFLFRSTPDDALLALAKGGTLRDPTALRAQVERMLQDPRASALTEDFAGQWLLLDGLADHQTDAAKFPSYSPALRDSMRQETTRFFDTFLHAALPVQDMMRADYTFIDDKLAKHYGLPAPQSGFMRTSTAGTERRGILGQASFLTVTSHAATTSPVKRGKWVLERLLCAAPPDPPPGVPTIEETPIKDAPLRTRLEAHRKSPACSGCHSSMDPIGFSFESFDAIGATRSKDDEGFAVDAAGQLPDGRKFSGAQELASIIAADPRFPLCLAEKLFVYALGRGVTSTDRPYLSDIDQQLSAQGGSLSTLISLIVLSEPFRARRGDPGASP